MRKPAAGPAPLIWTQPPPPPRQRSLGRAEIVTAALGVADEAGTDALTMKAVAARLGPYSAMRSKSPYRCTLNRSNASRPALATWSKNCRGALPGSLLNTS